MKRDYRREIMSYLQGKGFVSSGQLCEDLRLSKSTLSRIASSLPFPITKFGKASNTHFALLETLPILGSELPLFTVQENGSLMAKSKLYLFSNQHFLIEPGTLPYRGLPPEIAEMTPQGFMGRAFARKHSNDLGISEKPDDWSWKDLMSALARRGEDLPGNQIVGQESAERFQRLDYSENKKKDLTTLAHSAIQGQAIGSSAGGEQPKFSVYTEGKHCLVKFAGFDRSAGQQRWKDLLLAEHLALQVLAENNITTTQSELIQNGSMIFLLLERFDRVGKKGRKPVLTLASLDDHYFGGRDQWCLAATRFQKKGLIGPEDARLMKLLDAFGLLIGNTDRHFHNLAFIPDLKRPKKYQLAPVYDQLPMMYAPVFGQVVKNDWSTPVPNAAMIEVWDEALQLAQQFWKTLEKDRRLSSDFKKICSRISF